MEELVDNMYQMMMVDNMVTRKVLVADSMVVVVDCNMMDSDSNSMVVDYNNRL